MINSCQHLSEQMSISEQLLYLLTNKKEFYYRREMIPKKDGSKRNLDIPILNLKVVQRWILKEILEHIKVSKQAMAFVPNKNGLCENAESHKKNLFLLEMDIENFFGTITEKQVFSLFRHIGYNNDVAAILTNLCVYKGYLPQGAVTSPYIANLVCYNLDARIEGYCSRRDIIYTRYADDLTFSSNNRLLLNKVEKFVKYIVEDEGFKIKEQKTRYLSNDVKKTVTGITINDNSVHVDKRFKRRLRAQIYQAIKTKNYNERDQILGKIAFVNSIEDGFKDKTIAYISKLMNSIEFAGDEEIVNAFNSHKLMRELPEMKYMPDNKAKI